MQQPFSPPPDAHFPPFARVASPISPSQHLGKASILALNLLIHKLFTPTPPIRTLNSLLSLILHRIRRASKDITSLPIEEITNTMQSNRRIFNALAEYVMWGREMLVFPSRSLALLGWCVLEAQASPISEQAIDRKSANATWLQGIFVFCSFFVSSETESCLSSLLSHMILSVTCFRQRLWKTPFPLPEFNGHVKKVKFVI